MKDIIIEWKHYDKEGETCTRCNNTRKNISLILDELGKDPNYSQDQIKYFETKLKAEEMAESNSILINGVLIENILNLKPSQNYCHSCSCLSGSSTECKTLKSKNSEYEDIPKEIILKAIKIVSNN